MAAVQHGLRRIKEGFPLSLRLIREIHGILLRGDVVRTKTRGNFAAQIGFLVAVREMLHSFRRPRRK